MLKQKAVLILHNNRAEYYKAGVQGHAALPFSPQLVEHLEVLNEDELQKQLGVFVQTNKLIPSSLVIIISHELLFDKLFPKETKNLEDEIDKFKELVPFETPSLTRIPVPKGMLILAANSDFYTSFRLFFESQGWSVDAVVPALPCSKDPYLKQPLDRGTVSRILAKRETLKQYAFLTATQSAVILEEATEEKQSTKRNTIILVSVFGVLIVILGLLLLNMFGSNKKSEKTVPSPTSAVPTSAIKPVVTATIAPSVVPSGSSAAALSLYPVQLLVAQGFSDEATAVRTALQRAGFTNVRSSSAASVTITRPLVIFTSAVPADVRRLVLSSVEEIFPSISEQQTTSATAAITIRVGGQEEN